MRINYEMYGGKLMTTHIILNHDLQADFIIDLKENRYRLTIKNMVFIDRSSLFANNAGNAEVNRMKLDDYMVKKRRQTFRTGKTINTGLGYANSHFKDFFKYEIAEKSDW
jgi:hypothetical protein